MVEKNDHQGDWEHLNPSLSPLVRLRSTSKIIFTDPAKKIAGLTQVFPQYSFAYQQQER